jgi:uncharacterized protein (DUF362 family)
MSNPATIYVSQTRDRVGFIKKVFEIFAPKLAGKRILLKPNLVSGEPYPTTTHPDTLATLLDLLPKENVTIADAAAADLIRPGKAVRDHALNRLCRSRGQEIVDLYDRAMTAWQSPRGLELKLSTLPRKHDCLISLPVLKSHVNVRLTGAVKNQFGLLARTERGRLHFGRELLHQGIAESTVFARPALWIVDAVETLIGANEMRHGGRARPLGWMLAGEDPVALDAFGFSLLAPLDPKLNGFQPRDLLYLRLAQEYGVGGFEFELKQV